MPKKYLRPKPESIEDFNNVADVFLPMVYNSTYIWVVKRQKMMQVIGIGYKHFHWVLLIRGGCVQISSYLDTWAFNKEEIEITKNILKEKLL